MLFDKTERMLTRTKLGGAYNGEGDSIEMMTGSFNLEHYEKVIRAKHDRGEMRFSTENIKSRMKRDYIDLDNVKAGEVYEDGNGFLFVACHKKWGGEERVLGLCHHFKFHPIHLIKKSGHPSRRVCMHVTKLWDYNDSPFGFVE